MWVDDEYLGQIKPDVWFAGSADWAIKASEL